MDLPVPVAEPVVEEARSHTRQDGTLVIDVLVDPPCGESSEREIVVCASDGSEHGLDTPSPPPAEEGFKPEIQLSESAKAGLRAQRGRDGAVEAVVNLTITF